MHSEVAPGGAAVYSMGVGISLPDCGVAAHRGGAAHAPENTCSSLREAVRLGAHQIEFDLRRSADGAVIVIHDPRVDRTSDGRGAVSKLTLAQLRKLDAGAYFGADFVGERIPTLEEALDELPFDVWINLQIKRGEDIAAQVVETVLRQGRLQQCVLACGNAAGREARRVVPEVMLCNLVRQRSRIDYIAHAMESGSQFVQFHYLRGLPSELEVKRAHEAGLRINFFCTPDAKDTQGKEVDALFAAGVDFVLVDDVAGALAVAARHGISALQRNF